MSDLALLNPLRRLIRSDPMARDMDEFFKGFFLTPMSWSSQAGGQFPVDVTEDDNQYNVRAEIPGFNKEDIAVSVNGDQVSISAESKKEKEEKKGKDVVWRECYYGKQYRAFNLPQTVDESKTSAKYEDGVLSLVLPKKGNGSLKKIAIQ